MLIHDPLSPQNYIKNQVVTNYVPEKVPENGFFGYLFAPNAFAPAKSDTLKKTAQSKPTASQTEPLQLSFCSVLDVFSFVVVSVVFLRRFLPYCL